MRENQRWTVSAASQLSWRVWGDDVMVYHHGSADTHKLGVPAIHALEHLQKEPLTVDQLIGRLAGALGVMADDELRRYTQKLVVHFDALGLIEPAREGR